MPHRRSDDAGERHRQDEFPGEIHDLVNASAREGSAHPDVNKQQDRQLHQEPNIRRDEFERADRRMPAAEKQRHGQAADGKHANVFRHEKCGVFEPGIFSHVTGDDFRFPLRHVERCAVRFHEAGNEKQNERGRAPWRRDEPMRHHA